MLLAIIPARGGSKRFPRKNIAQLAGRPLIHYAIDVAKKSSIFDDVIVSTEDDEIAEIAEKSGASVQLRPSVLASDSANVPSVCLDVIDRYDTQVDAICILLPTSPLRRPKDIVDAYEKFKTSDADYLFSITDYHYSPFRALADENGYLKPFFGREYLQQDQKNPIVHVHDGSFIFCNVKQFKQDKTYYGDKIIGYLIHGTVDINEPSDMQLAEYLWSVQNENKDR